MKKLNLLRYPRTLSICALGSLLFVALDGVAAPIEISIEPESQVLSVGSSFEVDIEISGLDTADLGGFDFDLEFDPAVIGYQSYTISSDLLDPFDLTFDDGADGILSLSAVSLAFDLGAQLDDFTLATVSFDSIQPGTSPLTLSSIDLSDGFGGVLNVASVNNGSVAVPAPGTLLLAPFGLGMLLMHRRRIGRR